MGVKVEPAIFGLGAHAREAPPPPGVSGLEQPPAGSGRGEEEEEEEEMVPVGRRLWLWAGASSFHTGDCATDKAQSAPLPFPASGHMAPQGFRRPLLEGGTSLPDHPCCTSYTVPTGSTFKAYTVFRKNETERGEKKPNT